MKEEIIKFNKLVRGEGRNGYFFQSGVGLYDYGDIIHIHGLTSKGDPVVGHIKIPKENIDNLILALQKIK